METVLRITTTVLPGNRIEIVAPELIEGTQIEVIIILTPVPEPPRPSALEIIDSLQGHRAFAAPHDADSHLQEERNSREG